MTVCDVCGLPQVCSTRWNRVWCCVFGDHPVLGPSPLMWAADAELHAAEPGGRFTKERH